MLLQSLQASSGGTRTNWPFSDSFHSIKWAGVGRAVILFHRAVEAEIDMQTLQGLRASSSRSQDRIHFNLLRLYKANVIQGKKKDDLQIDVRVLMSAGS